MYKMLRHKFAWLVVASVLAAAPLLPGCSDNPATPRGGGKSSGEWSWVEVDSFVEGGRIQAIFGTGPEDIYTAYRRVDRYGDRWNLYPDGGVARYDGISWSAPIYSVNSKRPDLDLWASSPNDVYLADGTLRHFDGDSWRDTGVDAVAVGGITANDVYAAGADNVVSRFNGIRWNTIGTLSGEEPITAIHALPGPFVVVAREHGVATWDGATWTETPFLPDEYVEDVWAAAPKDVYAVGNGDPAPRVWHFDGTTWATMTVPNVYSLTAVWGNDADDIYACGLFGTLIHYNGSVWSTVECGTAKSLWDIWGDGSGTVYAAGEDRKVVRVDAGGWNSVGKRRPGLTRRVWAESSDRYAVVSAIDPGTVYLLDGGEWTEYYVAGDLQGHIRAIAGTSLDDIHVLIDRTTYHFDGDRWSPSGHLEAAYPAPMWFASPTDGFAAGGGSIYQGDGHSWTEVVSGLPWAMRAVWGASADAVYALNGERIIYFYDGETWSTIPSPIEEGPLLDISGVAADDVYVLTLHDLFRWDGSVWHDMGRPDDAYGMMLVVTADDGILVASDCQISHFDGTQWMTGGCDSYISIYQVTTALDGTVLQVRDNSLLKQVFR